MARVAPHLLKTHEQYPKGFPEREDDSLLGHWPTPDGMVIVENHPHGYEIHVYPCMECDACAGDRGPANPHTDDGRHFRLCEDRQGPILTVAGDRSRTVLEYLAQFGSQPHIHELERLAQQEVAAEALRRHKEREETLRQEQEEVREIAPSTEERLEALIAEVDLLKSQLQPDEEG